MRNILLITVDCLRADRLGYGRSLRQLSPWIDELAKASTVFTQAFATGPRTAESFPAILASTYSLSIGGSWELPEDIQSLAQVVGKAGYATGGFHSNPFLSTSLGYGRGFDTFWDSSDQTPVTSKVGARIMPRIRYDSAQYRVLRRLVRRFEASVGMAHYVPAEKVTTMALDWLQRQTGPFLLWVHFMDMHYPYAPPQDLVRQLRAGGISRRQQADLLVRSLEQPQNLTETQAHMLGDLYDAGLLYVDQQVQRLLDAVETQAGGDETVVILTGDHGEEFMEHGQFGHASLIHLPDGDRARIRLYDELLHVPLIIRAPGLSAGAIDSLVSLVDLPPTAADLAGVPIPESWQGVSLKPRMNGQAAESHSGVFSGYAVHAEMAYPLVAYRTAHWKYIHDGAFGNHELYDLVEDPAEKNNCYTPNHPAVSSLQEAVQQHLHFTGFSPHPAVESTMDAELKERLVGLGYLEQAGG